MSGFLFVYGTLRPCLAGPEQLRWIAPFPRIDSARIAGRLFDLGMYPGVVLDSAGSVLGDLLWLPQGEADLSLLDGYEDFRPHDPEGSLFRRVAQDVLTGSGLVVSAWVYITNDLPPGAVEIAHGDYRRWLGERQNR